MSSKLMSTNLTANVSSSPHYEPEPEPEPEPSIAAPVFSVFIILKPANYTKTCMSTALI